ncbi:MAG: toprim domain-containing protein [Lachnospiraceae bacterium]|nr:toprim domain-containing protein [Lachnospiraceae bacterium]
MYITSEDKEVIKSIDIVKYARFRNIRLSETSKGKAYKIIGEHLQGLYLYENSNGFYRFSTNEKGNIIDFVKLYDGCDYLEACEKLLKFSSGIKNKIDIKNVSSKIKSIDIKENIIIPQEDKDASDIHSYLVNERKIEDSIVHALINNGTIKQFTIHGNTYVGFIGKDENNIDKYLSLRSIKPTYEKKYDKYDYKNSDKTYAFKVDYKTENNLINVFLFEAPIDLLSYMSFLQINNNKLDNKIFLCSGGLNNKSINNLIEHNKDKIFNVAICFDNDNPGNNYADTLTKELAAKGIETIRIKPKHKDFNDDLIAYKNSLNLSHVR